jgi:hypothetical protein
MAATATERQDARADGLSPAEAERRLASVRSIGPLADRLIVAGIAVEIAVVALLAYNPGLRKAVVRRRQA